jgi:hypothetical protein
MKFVKQFFQSIGSIGKAEHRILCQTYNTDTAACRQCFARACENGCAALKRELANG